MTSSIFRARPTRRALRVLTASVAASVLAAPAIAAAQRTTPGNARKAPASTSGGAIPRIPFTMYTLPNGLQVILAPNHNTPLIAVNTWFHVGSSDERPGRTGLAHLFEHLMFMGSEHVPNGRFDQLLESAGANNNASTAADRTEYWETLPSNALALALYLDSDRMGFLLPTMDTAKVNLQRDVVKNERRQSYDNVPYGRADETVLAALYPRGHPYSWPVIGSMTDLSAASLEDVRDFFRTYYAPNNASLTISGDFDPDSARALIQKYYGDIPRGPQMPARPNPAAVTVPRDTFLVMEDKVQLPRVYYTWPTVRAFTKDDAALDILAFILTSGKNSRLYKKLVYDMQAAQDVTAYEASQRLGSYFRIAVTPRQGHSPAQMDSVVRAELASVISDGVSARELARAKNSYRSSFLQQLSTDLSRAEMLNQYNYIVGTPDFVQQDYARYANTTPADVQRVAREYLGRPKVVLTVVPEGQQATMVTGGNR